MSGDPCRISLLKVIPKFEIDRLSHSLHPGEPDALNKTARQRHYIMNQVILIGFIGKDPVSTTFDSGKNKTTFSLATSERRGGNTVTNWHSIVAWNGLAKIATDFLKKGSHVSIIGRISYRTFEKDGAKRYITEILCNKLEMLDRIPKKEGSQDQAPHTPVQEDDLPI